MIQTSLNGASVHDIRVIRSSVLDFLARPSRVWIRFIRREREGRLSRRALASASFWFPRFSFTFFYPSRVCDFQVRATGPCRPCGSRIAPVIDPLRRGRRWNFKRKLLQLGKVNWLADDYSHASLT